MLSKQLEVLDAYVGCKGEARKYILCNTFDSSFDTEIANWHDACDPYVKDPVTTPTIAAPTATLKIDKFNPSPEQTPSTHVRLQQMHPSSSP
ncbi:hypothetical protein Cob_v002402 [Colletotrichum orbiculare MAFF 240422]|uniref:Uncharacterized protein n=1 Tax=Colletotrichum orbiculare (strain 104-T / ATCC 96160 / CBS 514.97 / LARS 414 / MAFF 240422) TaxID=1213857 RepID=A0A484G305_COLOR|nr:hypothetical protein Cob_v002402 [Colletotrichum orbiculare MAFF 240422]